jgi:excisionase family DNA binding protein
MVMVEKLVLTVPEAGELLGVSRAHAYLMVKLGQIPVIKLGRRIVVPKAALEKMLETAVQPAGG